MENWNRRDFLSHCGLAALGMTCAAFADSASLPAEKKINSKKGIGLVTGQGCGWEAKINALNLGWHYSWGLKQPEGYPAGTRFVPMTWGPWGLDKTVAYLNEQKKLGRIDSLLGFNEPDQKSQSNIPVEKALELWPTLMKADVRLGSPACVHPDNEWMKTFMKEADNRKLRVDFVTVHDYGGPSPEALVNKCKKIYKMYGRPVWITEFAVGDWQAKDVKEHKHSPSRVLEFMQGILPELDKLDFVERYAWFPAGQNNSHLGTSALFDDAGELTLLGRFYAKYQ